MSCLTLLSAAPPAVDGSSAVQRVAVPLLAVVFGFVALMIVLMAFAIGFKALWARLLQWPWGAPRRSPDGPVSYEAVPLFSRGEMAFYLPLLTAVPSTHRVFAKVRWSDLVRPRSPDPKTYRRTLSRFNSRHVDFALYNAANDRVDLVIELDDRSHARPDRVTRDEQLDDAFQAAGVRVLHVPAQAAYDVVALKQAIADRLRQAAVERSAKARRR